MSRLFPSNPNPNANPAAISDYYQTRATHKGVVTSDWLAQAQDAVGAPASPDSSAAPAGGIGGGGCFSKTEEFNEWRKQPDLAEAVAAIRALAVVIRSSETRTMMELEIELKTASDCLKARDSRIVSLDVVLISFMNGGY